MKVVKRGTVGIALFVSGVLSIPAVVAVDRSHSGDLDNSLASSATTGSSTAYGAGAPNLGFGGLAGTASVSPVPAQPSGGIVQRGAAGAATASTSAITQARIRGFAGVTPGGTVSGQVQIRAIVTGTLNAITYTLNGSILISYDSLWQPYLFSPDGMGLDTTKIPNGIYTLRAVPRDSAGVSASVTFQVLNRNTPVLASSLAAPASYSYYQS